jgi:anaerobic ribonucleoside-triphosphate reductase activating protein
MSEVLRLARAHFPVTALGYGVRLGIWVQGCTLACPGCIAKDTWDRADGVAVLVDELLTDVRRAVAAGADGLTVSGGEPLQQPGPLATLLRGVRAAAPKDFDILLYTGYEPPEFDAAQRTAAELADVIVTGRYVATAPTRLIWRGSANQRLQQLTPLALERYAAFVDDEPDTAPIQIETSTDGRAWWVGVPNNPDTKRAVEATLTALGYSVDSVSWRRRPTG